MCENCWTDEIVSFSNKEFWPEFNLMLTRKLDEGNLRHNRITHEQSIYECLSCGERWKLRAPEDASGGYLLRLETPVAKKTPPTTILVVVFIGVIAILFARLLHYIFGN